MLQLNRTRGIQARTIVLAIFFNAFMIAGVVAQQPAAPNSSSGSTNQTQHDSGKEQAKPEATPKPVDPGSKGQAATPDFDSSTGRPFYQEIQEDWSSLQVGVSKLEAEAPLVAQTDEGETFTRTLVQMKWRPGDALDVYIILPKGVTKPPAVLYLYGYLDDTDRFRNNRWCERVTSGGVAAVGFVSALSGHRFHGRPLEQWFVSELQESLGSTVHDVHFILDYLAQRGDIDMNRIGMFGQASGGTIALLAAAAEPRIKAVDALDPWGDWPVWLAKSPIVKDDPNHTNFAADAQFLKKVAPLDPVRWLPTMTSTHIRIQQVMENESTPNASKDALRKAAPKQAEVVRFDHVKDLAAANSDGKLFDWMKDALKATPERTPNASMAATVGANASKAKQQ